MNHLSKLVFLVIVLGFPTVRLWAQPTLGRRGTNQPILLIDSSAPTSDVFSLRFVDDGAGGLRLLAGGDGKVLWQWQIKQVSESGEVQLDPLPRIRWPIDRGLRGIISSTSSGLLAGQPVVAYGGFGALPTVVQLQRLDDEHPIAALHSTATPSIQHGVYSLEFWPKPSNWLAVGCGSADPKQAVILIWDLQQAAHPPDVLKTEFDAVRFLKVSPNGQAVVAADSFGKKVRRWNIRPASPWHVDRVVDVEMPSPVVGFEWLDDKRCMVATLNHGFLRLEDASSPKPAQSSVRLILRNRTTRQLTLAPRDNGKNLSTWDLAPNQSSEVTTTAVKQIAIRDGKSEWQTTDLDLRASPVWELDVQETNGRLWLHASVGMSLLASADGVAVALKTGFSLDPKSPDFSKIHRHIDVSCVDSERPILAKLKDSMMSGQISALAVTSDGKFVAAAGEHSRPTSGGFGSQPIPEVRLWRVSDGALVAVTPDLQATSTELSPIQSVGLHHSLSRPGVPNVVQFSWSHGAHASLSQDEVLRRQVFTADKSKANAMQPREPPQVWDVRADSNRFWLSRSVPEKQEVGPFPHLDWFSREVWMAHRFLRQRKEYVAIAYSAGILVWDLERLRQKAGKPAIEQEQALVRCFYGHTGRLTCFDESEDGNWLISGARDGTISLWSLRGIDQPYDGTRELGLTLQREPGRMSVARVEGGMPAFFAGLEEGDLLDEIRLPRPERPEAEWRVRPEQWETALKQVVPGSEVHLRVGERSMVARLFHEPLWTLYPMLDGQWVMLTPSQVFGASSDEAMRRFGWHVNLGRGQENQVAFFPLDLFRQTYENVPPIVQTSWKEQKPVVRASSFEVPSQVEITRIAVASSQTNLTNNELAEASDLEIDLQVRASGSEVLQQLELWCNGQLIRQSRLDASSSAMSPVRWRVSKSSLRVGDRNLFIAIVRSDSAPKKDDPAEPRVKLVNRAIRTVFVAGSSRPRMHFLGIGVTDLDHAIRFQQSPAAIKPLRFAANDVCLLGRALAECSKESGFEPGEFRYLVPNAPEGIDISVEQLGQPTHDEVLKALDRLNKIAEPNDFVCVSISCHGFSAENGAYLVVQDTSPDFHNAVTDHELFEDRLWKLRCPTLLLLDACHSGSALTGDSLRGLNGFGLGPEILVSCKPRQESFEEDRLHQIGERWYGMSVFTASLLEALTGRELSTSDSSARQMSSVVYPVVIDRNSDGFISVEELGLHATRRVPSLQRLTGGLPNQATANQQPDLLPSLAFPRNRIRLKIPANH